MTEGGLIVTEGAEGAPTDDGRESKNSNPEKLGR